MRVVHVDTEQHVAYFDSGDILDIESYEDRDENPCLPEEAAYAHVKLTHTKFKKVRVNGDR